MVIFIGGLPGTGKTTLSKALAERLGIFHYDVDEVKKRVYPNDPDFDKNISEGIHFSDATRMEVLRQVAADFPRLAREHKHILVEEVLQKRSLRDIVYEAAQESFGNYIVIHITSGEDDVRQRLQSERESHILFKPWNVYLSLKQEFDGIPEADITYANEGDIEESIDKLIKAITPNMKA